MRLSLDSLALCHVLMACAALAALRRHFTVVGILSLMIGSGGIGAAWSQHSAGGGQWLHLRSGWHRPERSILAVAVRHLPFVLIACWLLSKRNRTA